MTIQGYVAIAVFVAAYVFIATEKIPRVAAALGGAALMVVIGAADLHSAFFSESTGIDWNVIFLLLGMMIIVGILRQTGVFEFLAIWAAKRGRARPFPIMVLLVVITAVASALLDNVTTILLIAPVTLVICRQLGLNVVPFLLAEVLASNIGGTATLIGDPPNIIIGSKAGLTFNDFVVNLAPLIVVLLAVFIGMCWLMFRKEFTYDATRAAQVLAMDERAAITRPRLLGKSLAILVLVLVMFTLHSIVDVAPSLVAMIGAGVLVAIAGVPSRDFLADVEWETLTFFAGLFIMVGALVHTGVVEQLGNALTDAVGDRYLLAASVLLVGSAAVSGVVDNIPFVATMAPLVAGLVAASGGDPQAGALWWALALGADLGGNATAIGASANVVATGIAAHHGHPISFWHFTRYGAMVTAMSIALAWPYLWLRYFT